MKRQRKKYETPYRPWDKERIETEKKLLKDFGLKRKREIWRAEGLLRKYRRLARELISKQDKEKEKILIGKLSKLGILTKEATLDDVLGLTVEDFLNRRLQTILFKQNLANTPKQARQFITHGHVFIGDRKITYPSYLVPVEEENKITVKITPLRSSKGETDGTTN
ncbi:MAG: 30S ribosomal protein S4 [Candidatus Aenigmatarchaeota archaeon]|nr:30S ribosomal protein S4 [Candidatus Aenigmarchaeota archaeon]